MRRYNHVTRKEDQTMSSYMETPEEIFQANRTVGGQWCEDLARMLVYERCLHSGDAEEIMRFALSVPGTAALEIKWPLWFDIIWMRLLKYRIIAHIGRRRKDHAKETDHDPCTFRSLSERA